ncbi:MAG: YaaA family protein [Ileibacterium sp.]|nr:YaaA family protein [Ileibacterium sp.]
MSDTKKMKVSDDHDFALSRPLFQKESVALWKKLEGMTEQELMDLFKCSKKTLAPVWEQLELSRQKVELPKSPALLSYEGIAFRSMAPNVFTDDELEYVNQHLRILSGQYGLLRPLDGVHPYRLEMGLKMEPSLYAWWNHKIADALDDDVIINLASKEYSKAVSPYKKLIDVRFFEEDALGKRREKGVYAKIARGTMVRWMAQNNISAPEELSRFDEIGYHFDKEASSSSCLVFVRKENHGQSNL